VARAAAHERLMLQQFSPEGLHPTEKTYAGTVLKELQPVRRIQIGEACEELYLMGVTPHWTRGRV